MYQTWDIGKVFSNFMEFLRTHGYRIFVSLITGAFTYHAGIALTDDPAYAIALVIMSEGLSLWYPFILEGAGQVYTSANKIIPSGLLQWIAAILGIVFSWTAIILTDIASATYIARDANLKFGELFSYFERVPEWSQKVVVYVLPVMGIVHAILLTTFYIFSKEAQHARNIRAIRRAADEKIRLANANAMKAKAEAEAGYYESLAYDKARLAGEAKAKIRLNSDFSLPVDENDPNA